jgi:hypothetical protein
VNSIPARWAIRRGRQELAIEVAVVLEGLVVEVGHALCQRERHLEVAPERHDRVQLLTATSQRKRGEIVAGEQRAGFAIDEPTRARALRHGKAHALGIEPGARREREHLSAGHRLAEPSAD